MLGMVASGNVTFDFLNTFSRNGYIQNYDSVNLIYIVTSIFILALCPRIGETFDFRRAILDNSQSIGRIVPVGALLATGIILASILLVNWPYVFLHFGYMTGASWADAQDRPLLSLNPVVHRSILFAITLLTPPMAFLFVIAGNIRSNSRLLRIPIGLFLVMGYLIAMGGSSRSAAFAPGTVAVAYFLFARDVRAAKVAGFIGLTVISLLYTLTARAQTEQGLLAIPTIMEDIFSSDAGGIAARLFLSFTEGIFVTSEGIWDTRLYDPAYALLSLSPLPSSIDGFADVRDVGQNRLSTYAPMPGVAELAQFGIFHSLFVIGLFVIAVKWSFSLQKRSPIIFILTNFLIMFAIYHIFAYPTRNALRFLWVCFAILGASALLNPQKKATALKTKPSVGIDPALRARRGLGLGRSTLKIPPS